MKFLKSSIVIALAILTLWSCEKEYSLEDAGGNATGTLKSDGFGDCLPSSVNGIFKKDSTLGTGNYIDVQINLTAGGSYTIISDTVNGFYFKGSGTAAPGLRTVRLRGFGKPLVGGNNEFRIGFGGSECFITVNVLNSSATIAVFTLVGGPGVCAAASASGSYTQGVALNISNTLTVSVNVATLGAYTLGAVSTNGMFFTSTGTFTTSGAQNVTLNGAGTPTTAGATSITVGNTATSCVFGIVVASSTGGTGSGTNFITANVNGIATTFNQNIVSTISSPTGFPVLLVAGEKVAGGSEGFAFSIILPVAATFTAGTTYNINQLAAGINVLVAYNDAVGNEFSIVSEVAPQTPGFSFTITTINSTRITGTFSGTVEDVVGGGVTRTITNGAFSVPL